MFTLPQIAVSGFLGVYAGCIPITVNLARLPYRRGAIIGIFFGVLTHFLTVIIDIACLAIAASLFDDPTLNLSLSWIFIGTCILCLHIFSSMGCKLMAKYFMAPSHPKDPINRQNLYATLKAKDSGKRSVVHDVVTLLEREPAPHDVRFSSAWIALFGFLSIASAIAWILIIYTTCINALLGAQPSDIAWYLTLAVRCGLLGLILILIHGAILFGLCRDLKRV